MDLTTPTAVREFLALCLDPGHGIKRTPAKLAQVMPHAMRNALEGYAPHLAELREAAESLKEHAAAADQVHAEALATWIRGEPSPVPDPAPATPHKERRERYAEALYNTLGTAPQHMLWVTLSSFGRAVWYARADAAIRLADDEVQQATRSAQGQRDPETSADEWPDLCPQNRVGDKAVQGQHFYLPDGPPRCVFCDVAAHWGGEPLVAPRVPAYVYNARSVNRTTKHAQGAEGRTLCHHHFRASEPMSIEEAARLPLCGGCRRALTGQTD